MSFFFPASDFLSQHPKVAKQQGELRQPWTIPLDVDGKGQGYRQGVRLRPGLHVLIDDYTLQEDMLTSVGKKGDRPPHLGLEMSYMLSGHNHLEEVSANHNFLGAGWWEGFEQKTALWQVGDRILKFDIHLDATVFKSFLGDQLEMLPDSLSGVIQSSRPIQTHDCFWQVGTTTPGMKLAIHQMLHCPYQGVTRWMYWESKVLELLVLRLEEIKRPSPETAVKSILKSGDLDRIHYAREIVHKRLTNPPSLLELSRLVGLNDYKLKLGFKQVFGTTVFGDLKRYRLEQARRLLEERQISVKAAAAAVGYVNKGHFAAAFRKQFGIYPHEVNR